MPEEKKSNMPAIAGVLVLVLAVASFGYYKYAKKESAVVPAVPEVPTVPNVPTSSEPVTKNSYKDGKYDVVGEYQSPAGPEKINVSSNSKG